MKLKSFLSNSKIQIILLLILTLLPFLCIFLSKLGPDWKHYTTPLPDKIKEDLCKKFVDINDNEKLCNDGNAIYGPDFYPYIERKLFRDDGEGLDFDSVQTLLGPYQVICEIFPKDSQFSQRCTYDLRGDRVHHFSIYFNKNDNVESVKMRLQVP